MHFKLGRSDLVVPWDADRSRLQRTNSARAIFMKNVANA